MSQPGIQAGFGEFLGAETLTAIKEAGFAVVRIMASAGDDGKTRELAEEVLANGLQPLVTVYQPSALRVIPEGALCELGNEPDIKHFGWTKDTYYAFVRESLPIVMDLNLHCYAGVMANLDKRGFDWLSGLRWGDIPDTLRCSMHRYPETGYGPTKAHRGFASREAEVKRLREIIGPRPMAITEVGYHNGFGEGGYTPEETSRHLRWEREFFSREGFELVVAYQINDGPVDDRSKESRFGLRERDGSWKASALEFTRPLA